MMHPKDATGNRGRHGGVVSRSRCGCLADVLSLPRAQYGQLRPWFGPERPGPLVWSHIVRTGHGRCLVDRWPNPRTVLAEVGGNISLRGDPEHLSDPDEPIVGFVDASESFLPKLRDLDADLHIWDRLIFELPDVARRPPQPVAAVGGATLAEGRSSAAVRRLTAADFGALAGLDESSRWIAKTFGGPTGLAGSELAWGVFDDGRLVSVAVPFYLGEHYEDLGVVTEQAFRRRGRSTACAAAVVADILARGRRPSWTTSPDNHASLGVAARLGFRLVREDVLYLVRTPVPTS